MSSSVLFDSALAVALHACARTQSHSDPVARTHTHTRTHTQTHTHTHTRAPKEPTTIPDTCYNTNSTYNARCAAAGATLSAANSASRAPATSARSLSQTVSVSTPCTTHACPARAQRDTRTHTDTTAPPTHRLRCHGGRHQVQNDVQSVRGSFPHLRARAACQRCCAQRRRGRAAHVPLERGEPPVP